MRRTLCVLLVCLSVSVLSARPKVAVVLSGGGAKGIAEVGILEALERNGIPVDMVLGTSMGALIGAFYSAGYSPGEIRDLMLKTDMLQVLNVTAEEDPLPLGDPFANDMANITRIGFGKEGLGLSPGILGDQGILTMLSSLLVKVVGVDDFDDLPIPFRAIATDSSSGGKIVYDSGSIIKAVRSSISLPVIFPPYPQGNGSYAVDGGLVDNLPLVLARELGADFVIGVDVGTSQHATLVATTLSQAMLNSLSLVIHSNTIPQYSSADIIIFPDLGTYNTLSFGSAKEIYQIGHDIAIDQDVQFRGLADRYVAAGGTLEKRDPDRKGTYGDLPDPVIKGVKIDNLSTFNDPETIPTVEEYQRYVGKTADKKTMESIAYQNDRLRSYYKLSAISSEIDKDGILHQTLQGFQNNQDELSFGGYSSVGYSNSRSADFIGYPIWFVPSLSVTLDLHRFEGKGIKLRERLFFGEPNYLSSEVGFLFLKVKGLKLSLNVEARLKWGSLSISTSSLNNNHFPQLDWGGRVDVGLKADLYDTMLCKVGARYDANNLYFNSVTTQWINVKGVYGGFIWDNLRGSDFTLGGGRLEVLADYSRANGKNYYDFRSDGEYRFELVHNRSSLGFNIRFETHHGAFQFTDSYAEYGGFDGMPGYGMGTWKRDVAMGGVVWKQRIASLFGMPLFTILTIRGGTADGFPDAISLNDELFYGCIGFDFGVSAALGLKTPFGDFSLGVGYSIKNKVSVMLGVI